MSMDLPSGWEYLQEAPGVIVPGPHPIGEGRATSLGMPQASIAKTLYFTQPSNQQCVAVLRTVDRFSSKSFYDLTGQENLSMTKDASLDHDPRDFRLPQGMVRGTCGPFLISPYRLTRVHYMVFDKSLEDTIEFAIPRTNGASFQTKPREIFEFLQTHYQTEYKTGRLGRPIILMQGDIRKKEL